MAYLNNDGVIYLWSKIKEFFVAKESGKGLSTNDYTTAEKTKLSGIATGATKNTVENVLTSTSTSNALSAYQGKVLDEKIKAINTNMGNLEERAMLKSVYDTDGDGVVDNAEKVNGHTVESDVPSDAVFTDTVYTHPSYTYSQLTGYPVANTTPTFGDSVTISGFVIDTTGHIKTISNKSVTIPKTEATTSLAGLMSKSDKSKLDALPTNATLESTYAKKTDITGVYKYIGSVASASALPTSGQKVGDVYNIETSSSYGAAGANVAWNGTAWDSLGEIFTVTSITNAELETICV